jgi:ferritin-like metal-binding protein YciE
MVGAASEASPPQGWYGLTYGRIMAGVHQSERTQGVRLLEASLKEEEKTDATLTELAQTCVNQEAHPEAA